MRDPQGSIGTGSGRPVEEREAPEHRGPPRPPGTAGRRKGYFQDGDFRLAHRRLSIQDVSPRGHGPMFTPDGAVGISFNVAKFCDFVELREELEKKGHTFPPAPTRR